MRVLYDTSLIVAGLIESHPQHEVALVHIERVPTSGYQIFVAAHSLAELYATLTRMPPPLRLPAQQAYALIKTNIIDAYEIAALETEDYFNILSDLANKGLTSGIIYDALIVRAGIKARVDRILTLNPRHFRLIYPEAAQIIVDPVKESAP